MTVQPVQTAADFTLTFNPASLTIRKGNSGSTLVMVSQPGGTAPVVLSASGLPSGVTASFSPASVANGSSTLTLDTKGNTTRGTYAITVQGVNSVATHQVNVSLTIQ